MALAETLDQLRRREQAQRLDQGEADIFAKVAEQLPQSPSLDNQTRDDLQPWLTWTTRASVRYAPAKPFVVAAYVLHEATTGASTGVILRRLNAISALHDKHSLADPVSTTVVRTVLGDVLAVDPPRSWTNREKASFVQLPPEIQAAISRRERERDKELRRLQNQVAERQKQTAPNESVATTQKELTPMAKEKGVGPYAGQDKDSKLRKDDSALGYHKPVDISKKVDEAWKIDDGFSGKLPNND